MPPTFGQRWIRLHCRHTDAESTQPYTSGAQTLLQHAHRDTVSDRNCNLIHTPSSKFAGAVRAPVKSWMRNSVQSMYFSLIAGEGEERKEMLSTADGNRFATCILETSPWGLPALKFPIQLQSRPGEKLVCCPVALGNPRTRLHPKISEGIAPLSPLTVIYNSVAYHLHLSHSKPATACVTTRLLLTTYAQT